MTLRAPLETFGGAGLARLGEGQDGRGRGAAADHPEHKGPPTYVAEFGAGAAGANSSLAMAVVSPPVTAASGPPSSGSGPSSSTSSPRSQIQTADTATTITQGATSGHSSPHFRFGRNGGWDPGCSLDVGECVLLTGCEFKREVSCWRWGPDQHSWRSAVG